MKHRMQGLKNVISCPTFTVWDSGAGLQRHSGYPFIRTLVLLISDTTPYTVRKQTRSQSENRDIGYRDMVSTYICMYTSIHPSILCCVAA